MDVWSVLFPQDLTSIASLSNAMDTLSCTTLEQVRSFSPAKRLRSCCELFARVEQTLGLTRQQLAHSWDVLRRYGNMSSATVLFVLEQAIQAGARGPHLLTAFGPGFSAYFAVADL